MRVADSCDLGAGALILAGAHHRSGSEMLTRMMGALCKRCYSVRRWKRQDSPIVDPSEHSPCKVDVDVGPQSPLGNASALVDAHMAGLRLVSSGQWTLSPSQLEAQMSVARVHWRMVHLVRAPIDLIISAFYYHQTTDEPWALESDPKWYVRMGLSPPLPTGLSFSEHLRQLNATAGVLLQAQHSMRLLAQMAAVAEACTASPEHCTNIWLKAFTTDFDRAASRLLSAIGAPAARHADLLSVLRRAGHLSSTQRQASKHVTSGKHPEQRAQLVGVLRVSAYGPALDRLQRRMNRVVGAPPPPCAYRSGAAVTAAAAGTARRTALRRGGWWASAEPVRTIWLNETEATPHRCCELCRAAVGPGCLYFNLRPGTVGSSSGGGGDGGAGGGHGKFHSGGAHTTSTTMLGSRGIRAAGSTPISVSLLLRPRCTLLTSRSTYHASRHGTPATTGEA